MIDSADGGKANDRQAPEAGLVAEAAATAENSLRYVPDRELIEHHLPAEVRERDTWRHVAYRLDQAARGGDVIYVVIALRLVLYLEKVPCVPQ